MRKSAHAPHAISREHAAKKLAADNVLHNRRHGKSSRPLLGRISPASKTKYLKRIADLKTLIHKLKENRVALTARLHDLKTEERRIEQIHHGWVSIFDAIRDPIFLHDREGRIVRANRVYAKHAGMDIKDVIGKLYWHVFPRREGPQPSCTLLVSGKHEAADEYLALDEGQIYECRLFAILDPSGQYLSSVHIMQDVTERKQMEETLRESEERFRQISLSAQDAILMMDNDGLIAFWNPAASRMFGYTAQEAMGQDMHSLIAPQRYHEASRKGFGRFRQTGEGPLIGGMLEINAKRRDGSEFPVELSISAIGLDKKWSAMAILRDITERKRAEDALRKEHEFISAIMDTSGALIVVLDNNGHIVRFNHACEKLTGYSQEEVNGKPIWDMLLVPEEVDPVKAVFTGLLAQQFPSEHENAWVTKDGYRRFVAWTNTVLANSHGAVEYVIGTGIDVTERRQAEQTLHAREIHFRALVENSSDITSLLDRNGAILYVSPATERLLQLSAEDLIGCNVFELVHPDDLPRVRHAFTHVLENPGVTGNAEYRMKSKDGAWLYLESLGKNLLDDPAVAGVVINSRDVTARRQAEESLLKSNRAFRTLSNFNQSLVQAADEDELLAAACQVIVDVGGYRLAWVGFAEQNENKSVRPVAQAGYEEGYLQTLNLTWADTEHGRGPSGTAIRTGKPCVIRHILEDTDLAPWRTEAIRCGYASSISLPLIVDKHILGVLAIFASEPDAFDADEVGLLTEFANDLSYGITSLRTRAERDQITYAHQHHLEILKKSLEDSVQAIATTLEMRDPYTSGHQKRVAQLSVAIAREMNLSEIQIEGIHFGSLIHDIGKIHIPAEILSYPGRLSKVQFELVKTHPEVGHDILKGIAFPWPVAEMVLQHHERLDGSGYPQGLKNGGIILEAKILGVADVVEAMASHRPYRPGLGIDKALEEITAHRGTRYDPDIVDACVRLFHEKRFTLEQ